MGAASLLRSFLINSGWDVENCPIYVNIALPDAPNDVMVIRDESPEITGYFQMSGQPVMFWRVGLVVRGENLTVLSSYLSQILNLLSALYYWPTGSWVLSSFTLETVEFLGKEFPESFREIGRITGKLGFSEE